MPSGYPRPFGKYHLLEPLAHGGMGALYLAVSGDRGMEKLCAVKTLLPQLDDSEYLRRFRDEAQVVIKLQHGNLVHVFDAGETEEQLYLAMEFVEGKDLRAVWNRCARKGLAFPIEVAVQIVKELCRGLAYAHSFGDLKLVHRDVSPPNVMLAYSGEVKLTDFGLASSTLGSRKTAPGLVYGKVSYMSPEQGRGNPLDGRSDLYSAGVLLWEMLTGRQLFPQGTKKPTELLLHVRDPDIQAPSQRASRVPKELDEIVLRALAIEPTGRYQDGEQMRQALAEYVAQVAPATDAARVADFLKELFGEEIEQERVARRLLVDQLHEGLLNPKFLPTPSNPDDEPTSPTLQTQVDRGARAADPANVAGTIIAERYRLVRLVGEGGMGRVYEAEHSEIGKRVAIKVLHPVYCRIPELVDRFRQEARAASRIGHPHIVDVTDSGTTSEGYVYVAMEFLEGVDLGKLIAQQGPLEIARAVSIATQISSAVAAAHAAGIIHRDLKPENIFLVTKEGNSDFVKIVDFGIATQMALGQPLHRLTRPGVAMGTPEYMAPEQAAGKSSDHRVDIYAIGALLYEMLAGTPPYEGENFMAILAKKATQSPKPLRKLRPEVPESIDRVVEQALSIDPKDRQETVDALAYELEKALSGRGEAVGKLLGLSTAVRQGGQAKPALVETPVSAQGTWRVKQRRLPLRLVGIAAGGAVAAALLWRGQRPEQPPKTEPVVEAPSEPLARVKEASRAVPTSSPPPIDHARPEPAVEGSRSSARVDPKLSAKRQLADARQHLAGGRYSQARREFVGLLRSSERAGALLGLGEVAWQQGSYAQAASLAKRAIAEGSGIAAHVLLGNAYLRLKKFDSASREYRHVLRIQSDHPDATRGLHLAQKKQVPR